MDDKVLGTLNTVNYFPLEMLPTKSGPYSDVGFLQHLTLHTIIQLFDFDNGKNKRKTGSGLVKIMIDL